MPIKSKRNVLYDPSLCYPEEVTAYDSAEFTIPASQTNYDVKSNQPNTFNNVPVARFVELLTDQTIGVRFNSVANPVITLTAVEAKLTIHPTEERLAVTNIFVTTGINATNIKLKLT